MTNQEFAYAEIQRLVASFKNLSASQRRSMNEMQTRLGYIPPLCITQEQLDEGLAIVEKALEVADGQVK